MSTGRRTFLTHSMILPALAARPPASAPAPGVRLALNAYSFNRPLLGGAMNLQDLVDYCAAHRLWALDATGYYFAGYPQAPSDEAVYRLKRHALVNGVSIHGTGVRNDLAVPDPAARAAAVRHVKEWIEVAHKLGASVLRVFSGRALPAGHSFEDVLGWMVPHFQECAEHGRRRGVVLGLQHHNDFLRTAAQTIQLVRAVDSEWFRVVLDVGSLRQGDPYEEIARLLSYAVSWQLKETVWYGAKETPIDLPRLKAIIDQAGYSGYLPIETLGSGDPRIGVARFLERVRAVFG